MNNKIILMYHSISSKAVPSVLGSFPIQFNEFKRHISILKEKGYTFDFISNLSIPNKSNTKTVYITGDDGTTDWTKNILPWCEKEKIPTHTGIITGPFEKNRVYPLTHLIQIILILRDENKLIKLSDTLKKEYLSPKEFEYINKIYHYETLEYRRIIKGAFNLILDHKLSSQLIGELSKTEQNALNERFEQLNYYKKFKFSEIGVHTKSHWALGDNTIEYVEDEIVSSHNLLKEFGLTPSKYFVSPMKPRYGAKLEDLIPHLQKLGFQGILDSNPGLWDQKSYIIPRFDAKDFDKII